MMWGYFANCPYNETKKKQMSYRVNEKGYYGEFGGAYIPEMYIQMLKSYIKII
jgi:tryptophan synthase beta chain